MACNTIVLIITEAGKSHFFRSKLFKTFTLDVALVQFFVPFYGVKSKKNISTVLKIEQVIFYYLFLF